MGIIPPDHMWATSTVKKVGLCWGQLARKP